MELIKGMRIQKKDINMKEIGLRCRIMRYSRHLSQAKLAKELGYSTANISNFERGLVRISLDLALAYSDYFNVSLDYIVKGQLILPEDTKYRLDNGGV